MSGSEATPGTTTSQWRVVGMSCEHCVAAVSEELGSLPGVTSVDVDLASGNVTVASTRPLPEQGVRAAVTEAGYALD